MSLFKFRTCAFDATALYNLIPLPPSEDGRAGMRIVSNGIAEKGVTFTFPTEQARDEGFNEFVNNLNSARQEAAVTAMVGGLTRHTQQKLG